MAPGERRERGGGVGGRERPCSSASSTRRCSLDGGARYRNGRRRIRVPSAGGSCPTGDPCAFCAMLVSRGPVYLSEKNSVDGGHAKRQIPRALRMHHRGRVRRPAAHRTGTTMDRRLLPRRRTVPQGREDMAEHPADHARKTAGAVIRRQERRLHWRTIRRSQRVDP